MRDMYTPHQNSGNQEESMHAILPNDLEFDSLNWEICSKDTLTHPSTPSPTAQFFPLSVTKRNEKLGEQMISDALDTLSLEERGRVENEIYGRKFGRQCINQQQTNDFTNFHESIDFQNEHLKKMDQALDRLKKSNRWNIKLAALELAEVQNEEYVRNPAFRLCFLRSEHWDACKAASRFVRFFDYKLELFGEEKLTKDICLEDLSRDEIDMMKKGYLQRLPTRDQAGRAIVFVLSNGQEFETLDSMARLFFYVMNDYDEETSRNGVVNLFFKIKDCTFRKSGDNAQDKMNLLNLKKWDRFGRDQSVRICGVHKFLPKQGTQAYVQINAMLNYAMQSLSIESRIRVRLHPGSYTEWLYDLMCLGISPASIPLREDLKVKRKNHMEYLAMKQLSERINAQTNSQDKNNLQRNLDSTLPLIQQMTDLPSNRDVLLGKGKPIQEFVGNKRLMTYIDQFVDQYVASSKLEKTHLALQMVYYVQGKCGHDRESDVDRDNNILGGRFLCKEHGIWMTVPDAVARDKCSHIFRHAVLRQRKQKKMKKSSLNTGTCGVRVRSEITMDEDSSRSSGKSYKRSKTPDSSS